MKFDIIHNGKIIDSKDFSEGSWKIGRAAGCDIQLRSAQVSKQHALLVIKGNKAAVVDLGSSNGVFVNGILVRKQRLEQDDEVNIAEFLIRVARPPRASARPAGGARSAPVDDGNLALNINYEPSSEADEAAAAAAAAELTSSPQERLLQLVDGKILAPLYGLMKTADWRLVLGSILISTLVASVILSVIPIIRWGRNITTQEALARAQTILSQTVRENYRILTKTNDATRLTVEAAESEKGILSCYIVDPKATTIMAPTKLYNQSVTDVYALDAIKKVNEGKQELVSVQKDDNIWIVAQPLYLFGEGNERILSAIVMATFEVPSGITSTFEPMVEAALFALVLSLGAYFLIYKMVVYPINQMHEQVDAALKGENVTVTSEAKLNELESLATAINFALSRFKSGGGGPSLSVAGTSGGGEDDAEFLAYIQTVQEFDAGSSDALLLLDRDKKVKYVGKALEDMLGMRNQYAQGQNISDACRDQSFAGTAIDLADRVASSLGEGQNATLEINGVARNVVAIGHKTSGGEISFVLITVKLGA